MFDFETIGKSVEKMLNEEKWIQWIHSGSRPATTNAEKIVNVAIGSVGSHCARCLNLNGCCFPENNMPPQPLHPNCHCIKEYIFAPIPNISSFAICPIEKITNWAFIDVAKKFFFESNGYDIIDADLIKYEYERQAVIKYANGEFILGKLVNYGQRITIRIELARKSFFNDTPLQINTGWMVYPNGKIILTTPATELSNKRR